MIIPLKSLNQIKSPSVVSQEIASIYEGNLDNVKNIKHHGGGVRFKHLKRHQKEFSMPSAFTTCSY